MAIQLKWKGSEYIVGVPARDLSDDDIAALELDAAALVAGGAYEWAEMPATEKAEAPKKEDKAVRRRYADKDVGED